MTRPGKGYRAGDRLTTGLPHPPPSLCEGQVPGTEDARLIPPVKISARITVSRETLGGLHPLDVLGLLRDPTPAEHAERERARAEHRFAREQLHRTHLAQHADVLDRLRARKQHIAVTIAELHRPQRAEYTLEASECRGCDAFGAEVEETTWPCSTYGAIADALGIRIEARP